MIHRHETEPPVHLGVHDGEVEAVTLLDRLPVGNDAPPSGSMRRAHARRLDGRHVNHLAERRHVGRDEIVLMRVARLERGFVAEALHIFVAAAQEFVRAILHPARDVRVRRAAVGGIVFEATVPGGLCDGVMTMPSAMTVGAPAIVSEDRVRNRRRGRETIVALDERLDAVGREHFERGALCCGGRRVRILCRCKSGPEIPLPLRYSQMACVVARMCASVNVPLSGVPRWPLVPKLTSWFASARSGFLFVVIAFESRDINEQVCGSGFASQ